MSQDLVAGHQRECMMPNPKKPNAAGAVCLLLGCLLLGGCQALSGVATTQNSDSNDTSLFQAENIFAASDDYSRLLGDHTLSLGLTFHADQINTHPGVYDNGSFMQGFNGSPEP